MGQKDSSLLLTCLLLGLALANNNQHVVIPVHKLEAKDPTSNEIVDQVHYVELKTGLKTGETRHTFKSIIDSTVDFFWIINRKTLNSHVSTDKLFNCQRGNGCEELTKCIQEPRNLLGGRVPTIQTLTGVPEAPCHLISTDIELQLKSTDLKKAPAYLALKLQETDIESQVFTSGIDSGLGLGPIDTNLDTTERAERQKDFAFDLFEKIKTKKGFSLTVSPHQATSNLILGSPNGYYYKGQLTNYRNRKIPSTPGLWELQIEKINLAHHVTVQLPTDDGVYDAQPLVILDTATQYIWGPASQVDKLVQQINEVSRAGCSKPVGQKYYVCTEYEVQNLPDITLTFSGESRSFTLKGEHYAVPQNNGGLQNSLLLIRESIYGTNTGLIGAYVKQWTFGTTFLNAVYTHFDFETGQISLATPVQTTPGNIHVEQNWFIAALIVGGLIVLLGIIALLTQFDPVQVPEIPEVPTQKPKAKVEKQSPNRKRSPSPQNQREAAVSPTQQTIIVQNFPYQGYPSTSNYQPNFVQYPNQFNPINSSARANTGQSVIHHQNY